MGEPTSVSPIQKAAGILQTIAGDAQFRARYEARLLFLREQNAFRIMERRHAILIGCVQICQRLLKLEPTPEDSLIVMNDEKLRELARRLELQLAACSREIGAEESALRNRRSISAMRRPERAMRPSRARDGVRIVARIGAKNAASCSGACSWPNDSSSRNRRRRERSAR